MTAMVNYRNVDWVQFFKNYSAEEGLRRVDEKDVDVFRREMTIVWSRLAQSEGLEVALRSLRDPELFDVLLPNVTDWDELIERLDKRKCSEHITLGQVIKWFSVVQGVLCILFLFPCLWPVLKKYLICQIVRKGKNKFLYINRSPELGGHLPPVNEYGCRLHQDHGKSEQYVTAYMILHVKSVATDWLPSNIKARVIKESKELRASKVLFENLCKKLQKYEDEYQAAVQRHLEESMRRRSQNEKSRISNFGRWCSEKLWQPLMRAGDDDDRSDRRSVIAYGQKPDKRRLRRTYSAIPAQEFEKEELINMHLLPMTPLPMTSDVKESASLFNLR